LDLINPIVMLPGAVVQDRLTEQDPGEATEFIGLLIQTLSLQRPIPSLPVPSSLQARVPAGQGLGLIIDPQVVDETALLDLAVQRNIPGGFGIIERIGTVLRDNHRLLEGREPLPDLWKGRLDPETDGYGQLYRLPQQLLMKQDPRHDFLEAFLQGFDENRFPHRGGLSNETLPELSGAPGVGVRGAGQEGIHDGQGTPVFPGVESPMTVRAPQVSHRPGTDGPSRSFVQEGIIAQIIEKTVRWVGRGPNEIRIRLEPEHLGALRMEISIKDHLVRASVVTENILVKEMIESSQDRLKVALADHGLKIDQFSVEVSRHSGDSGDPMNGFPFWGGSSDSRREGSHLASGVPVEATPGQTVTESKTGIDIVI